MPYETTEDLKRDVLFRAGEEQTGSNWNIKVIDYLNRVHRSLCSGASEFLPEYVEDWWWLRGDDVLTLAPTIEVGTVMVAQDSANLIFSSAPPPSLVNWRIRFTNHDTVYKIITHTAATTTAVMDSPFTGPTDAAQTFKLMKVQYDLSANVAALISPMVGFRKNPRIIGLSPERMDDLYPLPDLTSGIPTAFALEDERTVRFSHGGRTDGVSMRIEYRFRKMVDDLIDSPSSIPRVPLQWRHILSDMALTHVFLDKNDDRSNAHALAARTGLAGMLKENRRRIPKMGGVAGMIFPRMGGKYASNNQGPLRTESGLIIGGP